MIPELRLRAIVARLGDRRVHSLKLSVGELVSMDERQLRAQWQALTAGTPLAEARLEVQMIRPELQCMVCFQKYQPQNHETHCPHCGSVGAKILAGEEFHLESFEGDDG